MSRWLLVCAFIAGMNAASADDVFLKNGQVIYGEVQETPEGYRIRVEHGAVTLAKDQVLRIERKASALEAYRTRAEKMGEGSADDHYRLAAWCEARNLPRTARKEYHRAIRKDPDHIGARTALGYLRIDGKWMTREEHLLSRGYVHDGRRWISPEDRKKEEPAPPPEPAPEARIQIDVNVQYPPVYGAVYAWGGRRRGHRPGRPYIMYSPTLVLPANPYNRLIPDGGAPPRVRPRPAGVPSTAGPGRPPRVRVGPPAGIP